MIKKYLKGLFLSWFMFIVFTWGFSFRIIEETKSTWTFLKILTIIISTGMIIITLLSLNRKRTCESEYGLYCGELWFLVAVGSIACICKYATYYSDQIKIISVILFLTAFVVTTLMFLMRSKIKCWSLIQGIVGGIFLLYIFVASKVGRGIHYGIITDTFSDEKVQWIMYFLMMPIIIAIEVLGVMSILRRLSITIKNNKRYIKIRSC